MPDDARIFVIDNLPPEDVAMLQALYSRSSASVLTHLDKLSRTGSSKFMARYVVGYNHRSIADCGTTTIFLEGISQLAAKAFEDWPLYSGQETSTRYIDMAGRPIVDPLNTGESRAVLQGWMQLYTSLQAPVEGHVRRQYPQATNEDAEVYGRAVKARVFDILRGFLPAGVTTQCSWHTNLRQAAEHLAYLVYHPLEEVSKLAVQVRAQLAERYPDSGFLINMPSVSGVAPTGELAREEWTRAVASTFTYHKGIVRAQRALSGSPIMFSVSEDPVGVERYLLSYRHLIDSRPRGCVLPHFLADVGMFHFSFFLDFGSFRDLQRHRNGVCRMPLLSTRFGFETWYLEQLPKELQRGILGEVRALTTRLEQLPCSDEDQQYYVPLGFRVPVSVSYGLPATVYVMEIRSGKMVHPTLRAQALQMADVFSARFPQIKLHIDRSPNDWDVRRGSQTIIEKV